MLATIGQKMQKLIDHMVKTYPKNADVKRLKSNFNINSISEGGAELGYTSYSINKGERIVLCVRNTDKSIVKENVIMYVAIHELAHLMTKEVGHPETFWDNFRLLLAEAIKIGVYEYQDFGKKPQPYCGIQINSSVI